MSTCLEGNPVFVANIGIKQAQFPIPVFISGKRKDDNTLGLLRFGKFTIMYDFEMAELILFLSI